MRQLPFDALEIGMLVTVARPRTTQQVIESGIVMPTVTVVERRDDSYVGDILEVLSLDQPLVVVRRVWMRYGIAPGTGPFGQGNPFTLNPSDFPLWSVSPEFVAALGYVPPAKGVPHG